MLVIVGVLMEKLAPLAIKDGKLMDVKSAQPGGIEAPSLPIVKLLNVIVVGDFEEEEM